MRTECPEMNSLFVYCRKENEYQQRLAAQLAEVCRQPTVPTVVATDLFYPLDDLGHFFFVADRAYWSTKFHFEPLLRGQ